MLKVTTTAREQIQKQLAQANAKAIRVGVIRSGCSGFMYQMDIAKKIEDQDISFEVDGLCFVAKAEHQEMLEGVELDYVKEGVNSLFRFKNPNAKAECGCGESFTM